MQDAGGILRPPVQKLAASIRFCPTGQNRQSSPVSSTIHEKSELLPCGGWVRVSCFYQGYFLLIQRPWACQPGKLTDAFCVPFQGNIAQLYLRASAAFLRIICKNTKCSILALTYTTTYGILTILSAFGKGERCHAHWRNAETDAAGLSR